MRLLATALTPALLLATLPAAAQSATGGLTPWQASIAAKRDYDWPTRAEPVPVKREDPAVVAERQRRAAETAKLEADLAAAEGTRRALVLAGQLVPLELTQRIFDLKVELAR